MTQERFFELVYAWKDGDFTGDELYERVFVSSNVVGRREQLKMLEHIRHIKGLPIDVQNTIDKMYLSHL